MKRFEKIILGQTEKKIAEKVEEIIIKTTKIIIDKESKRII